MRFLYQYLSVSSSSVTFAVMFNLLLPSSFISSVLTPFTWRLMDRCSQCRSPQMLWWAQGFPAMPVRSTH